MPITGKELVRILKREGWKEDRTKGSHVTLVKGDKTVTVPVHAGREISVGTLKSINKITGLNIK